MPPHTTRGLSAIESWPDLVRVADAFQAHEAQRELHAYSYSCAYEFPDQRAERHRREDEWLAALAALESRLPIGSPAWVTHGLLRYELAARAASRVARFHLWDVNPAAGWHLDAARALRAARHEPPERRQRIIDWLRRLPDEVARRTRELREGAACGYVPPRRSVRVVCDQIDVLLSGRGMCAAGADSELNEIVGRSVRPALSRYRDFLSGPYQAATREDGALAAMPDGLRIYRSQLFRHTSLRVDPDELLEDARHEIERLDGELHDALERVYAHTSPQDAMRRLREDPRYRHRSRAEMLAYARATLARYKDGLAALFFATPDAPLAVEAMTAAEERSGALVYYQTPEGAANGRVVLNTAHARTRPRWETACLAAHEGYPGHHLERTYGDSRSTRHPASHELYCVAFREGWACYAERLATCPNSGATNVERAGCLLRALTMWLGAVVDASFHAGRMSREEGAELLTRRGATSPRDTSRRMDFILRLPAYAASYLAGYRELQRLHDMAHDALGNRLHLREFHDIVLRDGPITLPMLRANVSSWLAKERACSTRCGETP